MDSRYGPPMGQMITIAEHRYTDLTRTRGAFIDLVTPPFILLGRKPTIARKKPPETRVAKKTVRQGC